MTLRELLPAAEQNNGEAQPEVKAKKPRASRKKKDNEGAIAKTEGHSLVDQQRSDAAEFTSGLERQEEILTATVGYQRGQKLAHIRRAAQTAGAVDTLAEQTFDSIESLKDTLQNNAEGFDPVGFVSDLGLNMTGEESKELRERISQLSSQDYSRFLH